jgi:ferric-dicitrate binding protein FerR (iron transport regulator)
MTDEHGPEYPGGEAAEQRQWDAIHRFLDGLSPLPERRQVEKWMADDLTIQRYVKAHKKVWSMIGRRMGPAPLDSDDAWESIQDRIAEHDRQERFSLPGRGLEHLRVEDGGQLTGDPSHSGISWRVVGATAAILVIGGASMITLQLRDESVPMVTYAAPRGAPARAEILSDGSRVILAPDSRLRFSVDRRGNRIASLLGEAAFIVIHDPRRDFVVTAPGIVTHDLGTEFDVSAYSNTAPRVAVRSGRVSVRAAHGSAILAGGDIGKVDPTTGTLLVTPVNDSYFAWTMGQSAFDGVALRDIANELERRYDVNISIDNSALAAVSVTITVPDGTLDGALGLLTQTVAKLQYARDGRNVRLFRH